MSLSLDTRDDTLSSVAGKLEYSSNVLEKGRRALTACPTRRKLGFKMVLANKMQHGMNTAFLAFMALPLIGVQALVVKFADHAELKNATHAWCRDAGA